MNLFLAWCLKHWRVFAALAFLCAVAAAVGYRAYRMGQADGLAQVASMKEAQDNERVRFALEHAKAMEEQAKRYQTRAEAMSATAEQYQKALNDANRKHDRTVADLRAGNLRLRKQWQGCQVPAPGEAATGGRGTDADAELRADDSGHLVRVGAKCDAWIHSLQQTLKDERQAR